MEYLIAKPISLPILPTRTGTGDDAVPVVGSILSITPRASLLWKPLPAFKKISVFCHGPNINDNLGESFAPDALPLLAGSCSYVMSIVVRSARAPIRLRNHGVQSVVFCRYIPIVVSATLSSLTVSKGIRAAVLSKPTRI